MASNQKTQFDETRVSNRLAEKFEKRGIAKPTKALLDLWGVSATAFNKMLANEKQPSLDQAARMAQFLNCKLDDLVMIATKEHVVIDENALLKKYKAA